MIRRLLALLLSFFLIFQIGVIGYSQAVEAGEFIPSAIEFATESQAFQFLCGLMGVTPSTAFVASAGGVAVAGTLMMQKFEQWVIEQSYPVNVAMWLSKLKSGVIDKKDECFSAFKSWISSLSSDTVSDISYSFTGSFPAKEFVTIYRQGSYYMAIRFEDSVDLSLLYFVYNNQFYIVSTTRYPSELLFFYETTVQSSGTISSYNRKVIDGTTYYIYSISTQYMKDFTDIIIQADSFDSALNSVLSTNQISDFVFNPSLDGFIDGTKGAIDDLDLDNVTTLPIGVQTGDITIALDNVIDKLGSIESVLERIISGDLAIDKARQAADVVPVSKTKEGTISDVITEDKVIPVEDFVSDPNLIRPVVIPPSYDPNDYTVTGLQDVFPFCIPFDLIDFIGVLKADPETPVFVINCSFLGKKFEDFTFTIDLKPFDPLAKICRYSELFLFCVGLIIVTRNIIKG